MKKIEDNVKKKENKTLQQIDREKLDAKFKTKEKTSLN